MPWRCFPKKKASASVWTISAGNTGQGVAYAAAASSVTGVQINSMKHQDRQQEGCRDWRQDMVDLPPTQQHLRLSEIDYC